MAQHLNYLLGKRRETMSDEPAKTEPVDMTSAAYWKAQYQELEYNLRMWGVIEIMIRNNQVADYISDLERRLERTESFLEHASSRADALAKKMSEEDGAPVEEYADGRDFTPPYEP
jgi:hypothetical protein